MKELVAQGNSDQVAAETAWLEQNGGNVDDVVRDRDA